MIMDISFEHILPTDFDDHSKVWIYQSSRRFAMSEALKMEEMMQEFVEGWNSHGTPVKGYANLLFGQFVILMADETATGVSGCSTDSSVHLIKKIEQTFKVNMFDRLSLAFVIKNKIELLPLAQLNYALENNFITADTLYFNNLVSTKKDLLQKWIVPAKESWLANKLSVVN